MRFKYWTFKVFLRNKKDDVINEWINAQPLKAQVKIRTRIDFLETERLWTTRYCYKRHGYKGIYELRIIHNNIQYRPLGYFGPGLREFTLLIGAKEKGDRLEPINADQIANERRELVKIDRGYIDDFI